MIVFGVIGFLMKKFHVPLAPMIITALLGRSIENSLIQSYIVLDGNLLQLFQRPISAVLLLLAFIAIVFSFIQSTKKSNL